ncbi:hypothetical protein PIB30_031980 [Stylosanthes scabra]|uniref:Uncharacterized protein n=1 Tax=Stylosanthes scabra TaxID=79078 RepID=A0ABU6UCF6_9FABA|nr:hypothetical protein [Stylosanthes scabra]
MSNQTSESRYSRQKKTQITEPEELEELGFSDLPSSGATVPDIGLTWPMSIPNLPYIGPKPPDGPNPPRESLRVYKEEINSPPGTSSKPYPIVVLSEASKSLFGNPFLARFHPLTLTLSLLPWYLRSLQKSQTPRSLYETGEMSLSLRPQHVEDLYFGVRSK